MEIQNGVMSWQKLATSEVGLSESLVCRVVLYVRFINVAETMSAKSFFIGSNFVFVLLIGFTKTEI